jgi:bleomycin hydrolase
MVLPIYPKTGFILCRKAAQNWKETFNLSCFFSPENDNLTNLIRKKITHMNIRLLPCFAFCLFMGMSANAQPAGLKTLRSNEVTTVKDQGYSGTCWSFATISFLESELIRMGKPQTDLSEWFIVRHIYPEKVRNYLRTEGHSFLTAGGQCQDVLWVMDRRGLAPDTVFPGPMSDAGYFNSAALDTAVERFAKSIRKNEGETISPVWEDQLNQLLDEELGVPPTKFTLSDSFWTPKTYADQKLGLHKEDYIQFTSFNHHPFYSDFCLESRYNWSYSLYTNLPLETFIDVLDNALMQGYTVVLNCDVSEESFDFDKGVADYELAVADQDSRQLEFETGSTTVDHLMHITGLAENGKKQKYYITKNSWGTSNTCNGYMYLSENYIRQKAVSILVHKQAVPDKVATSLGWE